MSDADTIRRAAMKLRDYAQRTTNGPWEVDEEGIIIARHLSDDGYDDRLTRVTEDWIEDDTADYIAMMHPLVATALADVLDDVAARRYHTPTSPDLVMRLAREVSGDGR